MTTDTLRRLWPPEPHGPLRLAPPVEVRTPKCEPRPYTPAQEDRLLRLALMSDAEWRVERKRLFGEDAAPLWPPHLVMALAAWGLAGYLLWAK